MTLLETIPQVDGGIRYLCACPRGHIAVDATAAGSLEVVVTLGYRGDAKQRRRDVREARALVTADLEALADIYGDPARGFAGWYLPAKRYGRE